MNSPWRVFENTAGRIDAFEEAPLVPKVSGYVREVLADIGDTVEKDKVLIKLWIPEMQDELAQKEALVAQADAEVRQSEAAIAAAEAMVGSAAARVRQAQAGIGRSAGELQRWKSEHERVKELAAKGSVTPKLVDEALNQLHAAEAASEEAAAGVQSAEAALRSAESNVLKARADLVAVQAHLKVSQADLAHFKTMLKYAEIKAPFDGVVTQRGVDRGHYVHPSSGNADAPLLVVARTQLVRVKIDIPEMEAALVDAGEHGDQAFVVVQSLQNREFPAKVSRTSWSLNAGNRSLRTEIDLENADGALRPGMYATARILLQERPDVLTLPVTAILRDGQRVYCCRVEAGKIVHQPITLGLRSGADVEILTGLDGTETIVLIRGEGLQPGQAVEVLGPQT